MLFDAEINYDFAVVFTSHLHICQLVECKNLMQEVLGLKLSLWKAIVIVTEQNNREVAICLQILD